MKTTWRAVAARGLEHAQRPEHVHLGVELGPLDGRADVRLGREVEADVRLRRVERGVRVAADVALVQHGAGRDVLALPGREVVEHVHLVAAREQGLDDVRADEASAPCDERPHGLLS